MGCKKWDLLFFARPKSVEAPRAGAVKKGEEEKRERGRGSLLVFYGCLSSSSFSSYFDRLRFRFLSHAQTFRE